jgi:hypothetical protein
MTNDERRLQLASPCLDAAWHLAVRGPGGVEGVVVVLGDDSDSNARVLLRALGITPVTPLAAGKELSLVCVPREQVIAEVLSHDPELAMRLETPTPMKVTMVVLAYGGWSTLGLGRNVGLA